MAQNREEAHPQAAPVPVDGAPRTYTRRTALKSLVAGAGVTAAAALPGRWTKPVVDRVLVPAHAATSPEPTTTPTPTTTAAPTTTPAVTTTVCGPLSYRETVSLSFNTGARKVGILQKVAANIIPEAHAAPLLEGDLCITSEDCVNFEAKMWVEIDGDHYFEGSGTVGGGSATFDHTVVACGFDPFSVQISVSTVSDSGAEFAITGDLTASDTLPAGSGCPSKPPPCDTTTTTTLPPSS